MGFVVKKIPFGNKVMSLGTELIIAVSKGFNTGTDQGVVFEDINCPLPNDFANVAGFADENAGGKRGFGLANNFFGEFVGNRIDGKKSKEENNSKKRDEGLEFF